MLKKITKEKKNHHRFNNHIKLSVEYSYKHFLKTMIITGNSNLQDSVYWQYLQINTTPLKKLAAFQNAPGMRYTTVLSDTHYFFSEHSITITFLVT